MRPIIVAQLGFGSLGIEIFKVLKKNIKFKLVGVIDTDKSKVGKDCGLLADQKRSKIKIVDSIVGIKLKPSLVIQATTSHINEAWPQIQQIAKRKISVISTCEELVYPHGKNKKIAKKIGKLAKRNEVCVLAIGINPGFLMDSLVLILTSLCSKINKISVRRVVNIAKRRRALQKKMWVGNSPQEFGKLKGRAGHVGLEESAMMIADSLNMKLNLTIKTRPIIAKRVLSSNGLKINRGRIAGMCHQLDGKIKGRKFLEMRLCMYVGAEEYDSVDISGVPPVQLKTNGVSGDSSTVALLLNYIPILLASKPGLHTVNKFPVPSFIF